MNFDDFAVGRNWTAYVTVQQAQLANVVRDEELMVLSADN